MAFIKCLQKMSFFEGLEEERSLFFSKAIRHELKKGSSLFSRNEQVTNCYYLEKGLVKIYDVTESGKEPIFFLRRTGEMFGLAEIFSGDKRMTNAQVLVPSEKVYRIKDGKRVCQERLFYPGYVLIEAELTGELQYIIRNEVPHMSGFLTEKRDVSRGNGKTQEEKIPIPLRDSEVKRILGEQDEVAVSEGETVIDYNVGEAVKITDGPFSGFDGTVEEIIEDRSKLKVMVMIFGRKTLLELNFTQVTKE